MRIITVIAILTLVKGDANSKSKAIGYTYEISNSDFTHETSNEGVIQQSSSTENSFFDSPATNVPLNFQYSQQGNNFMQELPEITSLHQTFGTPVEDKQKLEPHQIYGFPSSDSANNLATEKQYVENLNSIHDESFENKNSQMIEVEGHPSSMKSVEGKIDIRLQDSTDVADKTSDNQVNRKADSPTLKERNKGNEDSFIQLLEEKITDLAENSFSNLQLLPEPPSVIIIPPQTATTIHQTPTYLQELPLREVQLSNGNIETSYSSSHKSAINSGNYFLNTQQYPNQEQTLITTANSNDYEHNSFPQHLQLVVFPIVEQYSSFGTNQYSLPYPINHMSSQFSSYVQTTNANNHQKYIDPSLTLYSDQNNYYVNHHRTNIPQYVQVSNPSITRISLIKTQRQVHPSTASEEKSFIKDQYQIEPR